MSDDTKTRNALLMKNSDSIATEKIDFPSRLMLTETSACIFLGECRKGLLVQMISYLRSPVVAVFFSLLAIIWLSQTVEFSELDSQIFRTARYQYLVPFGMLVLAILVLFALRWWLLLGGKLGALSSLAAVTVGLGANMILPARGGDLLRLHYTHVRTDKRWSELIGVIAVEKIVDLLTIAACGAIVMLAMLNIDHPGLKMALRGTLILLGCIVSGILLLALADRPLLRLLRRLCLALRVNPRFEHSIERLLTSVRSLLTPRLLGASVLVTCLLWLLAYAGAYQVVARLLEIDLSYPEVLLVLCAGSLGLMLPAAPSGVGTYHASVVSAFVLLGRPASEGLLLATATHLLFFISLALPALFVYPIASYRKHRTDAAENDA